MNTRRASRASPQNESKNSTASKLPKLPPLEISFWQLGLDSALRKVTPQDLALVAAGLSGGGKIDEKKAEKLIEQACMLLGMAACRLKFVPPPTVGMVGPPATPPREISGASFLRLSLPGNGAVYTERRREFIRQLMLYLAQNGADETLQQADGKIDIDKITEKFKKTKLSHQYLEVCESIVAQIKGSPEAKEKQRKARQKGGRARAAQQLTQHLNNNHGWAHFEALIRDRKYTHNTIDQLILEFPEEFEAFEHHGLPAVRLRLRI